MEHVGVGEHPPRRAPHRVPLRDRGVPVVGRGAEPAEAAGSSARAARSWSAPRALVGREVERGRPRGRRTARPPPAAGRPATSPTPSRWTRPRGAPPTRDRPRAPGAATAAPTPRAPSRARRSSGTQPGHGARRPSRAGTTSAWVSGSSPCGVPASTRRSSSVPCPASSGTRRARATAPTPTPPSSPSSPRTHPHGVARLPRHARLLPDPTEIRTPHRHPVADASPEGKKQTSQPHREPGGPGCRTTPIHCVPCHPARLARGDDHCAPATPPSGLPTPFSVPTGRLDASVRPRSRGPVLLERIRRRERGGGDRAHRSRHRRLPASAGARVPTRAHRTCSDIGRAVQEGASAFLQRQFRTLALFIVIVFLRAARAARRQLRRAHRALDRLRLRRAVLGDASVPGHERWPPRRTSASPRPRTPRWA